MNSYSTRSEEETTALGRMLARQLPKRCVVLLIGNLGAGKTALAKGILNGLGVAEADEVTSPTFTLIHEYGQGEYGQGVSGAARAYHLDLYRLESEAEVESLGLDELFDREAVVLIEWGERFPRLMPAKRFEIEITTALDESRKIVVRGVGGADRSRTDE